MKLRKKCVILAVTIVGALMLIGVFSAHAAPIEVNPGPIGGPANNFSFEVPEDAYVVDLVFTDNKALQYGAGTHLFSLIGRAEGYYYGAFLDASNDPISGTAFVGRFSNSIDPLKFAIVNLSDPTVFSGMRFIAATNEGLPAFLLGPYNLSWIGDPPTVVPVPAAVWLLGGGLIGLLGLRRRFKR